MSNRNMRSCLAGLSLTVLGTLSCLAAGQSVTNKSTNSPDLNCVSVEVNQRNATNVETFTELHLSIENKCGKDISAIGINFAPNQTTQWDWIETLFLDQKMQSGILLTGTTKQLSIPRGSLPEHPTLPPIISFALFMDRTALGDVKAISTIINGRLQELAAYEQRGESLADIAALGRTVSSEAISAYLAERYNSLQPSNRSYLANLGEDMDRSEASNWPSYIADEQDRVHEEIALLKLQTEISIQTAARARITR